MDEIWLFNALYAWSIIIFMGRIHFRLQNLLSITALIDKLHDNHLEVKRKHQHWRFPTTDVRIEVPFGDIYSC